MIEWSKLPFAEQKHQGSGHLFRVGCGIHFSAPYYFEEPDENMCDGKRPPPNADGTLEFDDVVLVVARQKWRHGSRNFWKVLSKVGVVWTEAKYFSSQGIEV